MDTQDIEGLCNLLRSHNYDDVSLGLNILENNPVPRKKEEAKRLLLVLLNNTHKFLQGYKYVLGRGVGRTAAYSSAEDAEKYVRTIIDKLFKRSNADLTEIYLHEEGEKWHKLGREAGLRTRE